MSQAGHEVWSNFNSAKAKWDNPQQPDTGEPMARRELTTVTCKKKEARLATGPLLLQGVVDAQNAEVNTSEEPVSWRPKYCELAPRP